MSTTIEDDKAIDTSAMKLGESQGHPADNCIMVIFGAAGDLTTRKLIPALYNLGKSDHLPKNFAIVGFAFDSLSQDEFRAKVKKDIGQFAPGSDRPNPLRLADRAALLHLRRFPRRSEVRRAQGKAGRVGQDLWDARAIIFITWQPLHSSFRKS